MNGKINIKKIMNNVGKNSLQASQQLRMVKATRKNKALQLASKKIRQNVKKILKENSKDLFNAKRRNLKNSMIDRLELNKDRILSMQNSLEEIVNLEDPIGSILSKHKRPNGLIIKKIRVPIGIIGIIYESRPNVTVDAGALCLKSGNACVLRGGTESYYSNKIIFSCLQEAIKESGLPTHTVQLIPTIDRRAVTYMLSQMTNIFDLVIPRGGKSLIKKIKKDSKVPILGHLEGICHVYVEKTAKISMAKKIVRNSKMRRTGICGAAETLLIDKACIKTHLKPITDELINAGCTIRGDNEIKKQDKRIKKAEENDWRTEYLDSILSIKSVNNTEEAVKHITKYGSGHTETIISEDNHAVNIFLKNIDSAILMHNASTQFADGNEFGKGAEIGISTSKIHARGPIALEELTSFKYTIYGRGQIR